MQKWLAIVGIGEDGIAGLSAIARSLVDQAGVIVGGTRHLAMLSGGDGLPAQSAYRRETLVWEAPIERTVEEICRRRGSAVCVLASGDPMCHGIGVTLLRRIPLAEVVIVPAPSAFSLACARLGWALADVDTFSLTNRPAAAIASNLYPGAQLLVLSANRTSAAAVAALLTQMGYGSSQITVLEHMGGEQERRVEGTAADWDIPDTDLANLNTLAIACVADSGTRSRPRLPGLPDAAFHHDGQLTKREVRAITLSTLAPLPGELLWDVGAGCGSIAIEWLRSHPRCRAIAIERHPTRLQYIADNAIALGVPQLQRVAGDAPLALKDLATPDAIFIGGGATIEGVFEICWAVLRPGGRLVVNAVTLESEQQVLQWQQHWGGDLIRIGIQRAAPIGSFLGWKPFAPITQWHVFKPDCPAS